VIDGNRVLSRAQQAFHVLEFDLISHLEIAFIIAIIMHHSIIDFNYRTYYTGSCALILNYTVLVAWNLV
jgi:hypothetical protein